MSTESGNASTMPLYAVFVPATALAYSAWKILSMIQEKNKKPFAGLPMPPNPHWLLGHVKMFRLELTEFFHRLAVQYANKYGQTGFWMLGSPVVVITDPEDVRAVLVNNSVRLQPPHVDRHMRKFVGDHSVLILNNRLWKFHRAATMRALSPTVVDESRAAIQDVMDTLMNAFRTKCTFPLTNYDVEPLMKMITIDIFGKNSLSTDFGCCRELKPSAVAVAFDFLGDQFMERLKNPFGISASFYWMPTAANRRYAQERGLIRGFLKKLVEERKSGKEMPCDTISILMGTHDQLKNDEDRALRKDMSEDVLSEALVDNLVTLLFGGYDTSSIALTYALHQIATYPEVEERLLEEIHRTGAKTADDLVYCRAVIYEALRLFPPAVLTNRTTTKEMKMTGGFVAPKGTYFLMPIWTIQRQEKAFPRPLEFLPDRWAKWDKASGSWKERDETDDSGSIPPANRNAFFAFSSGGRSCPGYRFAMNETILVLSQLVKNLKFTLPDDYELKPFRCGVVQHPKGGMPMKIEWRNNNS